MGYARQWKGRLVEKEDECPLCKGLGATAGQGGGLIVCPMCHGNGVNPALNEDRGTGCEGARTKARVQGA